MAKYKLFNLSKDIWMFIELEIFGMFENFQSTNLGKENKTEK